MAETHAIEICSSALVLLGAEPITTFQSGGAASQVAVNRYAPVRDALLAGHPWRFNKMVKTLARLADAPPEPWGALYALPTDLVYRIAAVEVNGVEVEAEAYGVTLAVDAEVADVVVLTYHGLCDETVFTPAFKLALTYRLASEFALPITEDANRQVAFYRMSDEELRRARHQNATEHSFGLRATRLQGLRRR